MAIRSSEARDKRWHIAVLIPARNEEALLPQCLESILIARAHLLLNVTCDVVIAVDQSTDRTEGIAERLVGSSGTVVRTEAGNVGFARSLAAQTAMQRYQGPLHHCWLANTDADCTVPPAWLVDQLCMAEAGIEAIAGTVDVDTFAEHSPKVESLFRAAYLVRPNGSHPHVHGANFGVRADAYLKAGGWSDLATAEDHDLWRRLGEVSCRLVSTHRLCVLTSGRRVGRAPHGFAEALGLHNETAA